MKTTTGIVLQLRQARVRPCIGRFRRRVVCALLGAGLLALICWLDLRLVPLPPALFARPVSEIEFRDRHDQPLRIVRPEDNPFGHSLAYADIPRPLIEATLAAEDRRFWNHHGVDWRATLRAMWQLAVNHRVISGGSTITQQLIKLAEPRPRTLRTKLIEAVQAMRLEQMWDKQRILTEYFNRLDYGNFNRGAAAAARFYFAKPLHDLSPAECALLAALPQAPSRLNPYAYLDRARKRQQWILHQMQTAGWLTEQEFQRTLNEPANLAKPRRVFEAPHFVDLLLATVGDETREQLERAPSVRTTLDLELNHFAERTLRAHLSNLQAQHVSNGAIVMLDNRSGDVLALVGSEDYFSTAAGQVNGAWAPRSPGSAIKPFTYLLALERGATPASVVADVPTEFATSTGLFAPVNYNRHSYGPMRYRVALANSLNVSAVNVLASVGGPEPLQHLLQQCGLTTLNRAPEQYGLGLTIGNAEARLLELANAYACLARLGEYQPYRLLAAPRNAPSRRNAGRIAGADNAYLIADILSDNDARSLAFGAESSLRFDFPVACKTGTSSDFRDNWAFGYTPEFTVGVWMGNADGSPMQNVSGVTGAAPILHELFEHLHQRYGTSWYSPPPNVVECWINPITGKRLREPEPLWTSGVIKEKFLAQDLPAIESPEDYERLSAATRAVRLGSEYRDWFSSGDNWLGDRAVLSTTTGTLRILFPPPGTMLYLDADLPQQGRRMYLQAAGPDHLQWQSDSLSLAREGSHEIALLTKGQHQIIVRDPISGAEAKTWIDVRVR
jgi:penicillin-binding protein 1C